MGCEWSSGSEGYGLCRDDKIYYLVQQQKTERENTDAVVRRLYGLDLEVQGNEGKDEGLNIRRLSTNYSGEASAFVP